MNKITDIFGYISSKQMNLEYIEKILLQHASDHASVCSVSVSHSHSLAPHFPLQ